MLSAAIFIDYNRQTGHAAQAATLTGAYHENINTASKDKTIVFHSTNFAGCCIVDSRDKCLCTNC